MASPFDALDAQLSAAVESAFGEAVLVQPMVRGSAYAAPIPDPDRPPVAATGIFSAVAKSVPFGEQRSGSKLQTMTHMTGGGSTLFLSRAQLLALGYTLRQNDRVCLTSRPGAPVYIVSDLLPVDTGDMTLVLALWS